MLKKLFSWFFIYQLFFVFLALPQASYASLFEGMSVEEEIELGQEFDMIMKSQAPIIYDPYVRDYLNRITQKLLLHAPAQPYAFESNMLIDPVLNAFAYPGGFMIINTGLFLRLENESELAGIMAHEIAHVTQRHIASRQGKSNAVMIGTLLAAAAAILVGQSSNSMNSTESILVGSLAAGQAALLKYSRTDETESDQVGFQYMVGAGYNPLGYVTAFKKLQAQNFIPSQVPAYLTTHPDLNARISGIEARIRTQEDLRNREVDSQDFLEVQTFVRAYYDSIPQARHIFSQMDQNKGLTQLAWGILYARENNISAAKVAYSKALELEPENTLFIREIGRFEFLYGDVQKAFSLLTQASEKDSKDFMAKFFLAKAQDELGLNAQAQSNYEALLKQFPYDSEIHNNLGLSYGKNNNMFKGYLHLAYSFMYKGDFIRASSYEKQAKNIAKNPEEIKSLEEYSKNSTIYKKALGQ